MLKIKDLKKSYADRVVLDIDEFSVYEGDKIGLVGANGEGKSTLLKAIIGDIEIDSGSIILDDSYAYISQLENDFDVCEDSKIRSMLNAPEDFDDNLSGGEKTKLKIAQALKEDKKIIIADEPTANIDSKSIEVLENMFREYKGAMILVSHDRDFLNKLCNIIIELKDGKLKVYNGNYSDYILQKENERDRENFEYESYVSEKRRLENAILDKKNSSNSVRKTPKRMGNSEARLHKMGGQQQKKKIDNAAKGIKSRIEQLEVKEKPKEDKEIKIIIKEGIEVIGKNILEAKDLDLKVEDKLLLDNVSFKVKRDKKVALIGENGAGKTTLIKEIIKAYKEKSNDNLRINPRVIVGYFDQEQKVLDEDLSILDNIKLNSSFNETFIRINLNLFGFNGDDVYKKVGVLSGGEKVKVSLCRIILEDNNFLILDEPTNYLDVISIEALENAVKNTEKTALIVSHDRKFISNVCDGIMEIKDKKIFEYNCGYEDYLNEKEVREKGNKAKAEDREKYLKEEHDKDKILLLQNKLSSVISMISITGDEKRRTELEEEYNNLLKEINSLRN